MTTRFSGLLILLFSLASAARAQIPDALHQDVRVLMVSDIHFDPFHDPSKFAQLQKASVAQWAAILNSAPASSDAAKFASLQTTCAAHGVDTPWPLFQSSLAAEHAQLANPLFITVSGDLLTHQFDCRFRTLSGKASNKDYSAFAVKTVAFVAFELHQRFAGIPIYFALGNNDSGCGDYREDAHSEFLSADGDIFAQAAPNAKQRDTIARDFSNQGDYSVLLPAPIEHTRLIVLQNIFESSHYATCGGTPGTSAAAEQLAWLRAQLARARATHEHVWFMAHIPPGVDVYATLIGKHKVCTGQSPAMFLQSETLADLLATNGDIIRLAIFAHSHMDEMRLFRAANGRRVAIKMVPSISPVNGNHPAFTVAWVDPKTATLMDYEVIVAGNTTGYNTHWREEYRFSKAYGLKEYTADSLASLLQQMTITKASSPAAMAYQRYFYAGDSGLHALALHFVWPAYACALTHAHAADYRTCLCGASNSHP